MSAVDERTKRTARRVGYFALAALLAAPVVAIAQDWQHGYKSFSLKTTVTITGNALNSFDISWVDPELNAYFLADRSNKAVDVIDTRYKTQSKLDVGGFVGFTGNNNTSGPNGVLTIDDQNGPWDHVGHRSAEVWAGDGNSTVKVIDYATDTVTHIIPTNGADRADELCYDAADHLIQIANDADTPPFISFIPTQGPNAYKVVKQIKFDGKPGDGPNATNGIEQCQWNPRNGLIYLNLPEVNGSGADTADGNVVVIDPRKMEIVAKFDIPVAQCAGPQGMAIGPAPQILLGCNAKGPPALTGPQNAGIMDERSGKLIAVLNNQGGNDEVWFNPGDGLYFLAEGSNATAEQLGIVNSQPIKFEQDIIIAQPPGTGHAHSVAADSNANEVYMPIPNNVGGTQNPCPNPAAGCVAVYWNGQYRQFGE